MNRLLGLSLYVATGIFSPAIGATEPPITAAAFAPDGKSLCAVSQAGLHVFSWPELHHKQTIPTSTSNLHCVCFSPNGKRLAVGGGTPSEQGVVEVFSWPETAPVATFNEHLDSVRSVVWQDNDRLLSASVDRHIKLWALGQKGALEQKGALKRKTEAVLTVQGHSRSVDAICLVQKGQTIVSTGADLSVRVWDLKSGDLIRSLNQHTKPVHALAVRPGEGLPMVASAAGDRTIRFWQPTIGRMVRYVRLESEPLNIAWTHDGTRILAACVDGHVRVVDPVEVTVTQDLPAIDGWAYAIAMHPQQSSFVVGGTNGRIRSMRLRSD